MKSEDPKRAGARVPAARAEHLGPETGGANRIGAGKIPRPRAHTDTP